MGGRWRTGSWQAPAVLVETCWRPMEGDVAGDFHDIIDLRDGRLVVVVGDAPGFGSSAAALADDLRGMLREQFRHTDDPCEVLQRVDAEVRARHDELVATVACVTIDPAQPSVGVASAGHLPVLYANHSGAVFLDGAGDPPLGVASERRLVRHPLPGEGVIVLYTDGLVERRGRPLDETLDELLAVARETASPGAYALARRVTARLGEPTDDATVLALRLVAEEEPADAEPIAVGPVAAQAGRAGAGRPEVVLHFYADPRDLRSAQTEAVVRDLARRLADRLDLRIEVVDVTAPGADIETHGVLAAPTVVRVSPEPRVRVIGGLRSAADLARDLQLPPPTEDH